MGELIAGGIVAALGAFTLIYTIVNPKLTFSPPLSDGAPGAGFFPIILSVLLIILGLILVIRNALIIKKNKESAEPALEEKKINKANMKTSLLLLASIIVFLILWKITGIFYVWMFILVGGISKIYKRNWKQTIIIAACVTAVLYLMFSVGFSIQFRV